MIRYIGSRKQCFAFDNIETIETPCPIIAASRN